MDHPRCLARRAGRPRRGHPPGAAARPDLRARAQGGQGDGGVTRLTTCLDAESVAERAAAHVARRLHRAREQRGVAHIALSGGTTPGRTYELLAREPAEWQEVEVWFADERCVAPDDPESNYRLAAETLLNPAAIPAERVHRMQGELGAAEGARRYEQELIEGLPSLGGGPPVLDVIVLGIGPDAHIASLFPGAETLDAGPEAICLPITDSPKPPPSRGASPKKNPANGGVPKVAQRLVNPANPATRLFRMAPEQRERAFEQMNPQQQESARKLMQWFDGLPKEQQTIQLRRLERFEQLPPEQRTEVRGLLKEAQDLSADRRLQVRQAL